MSKKERRSDKEKSCAHSSTVCCRDRSVVRSVRMMQMPVKKPNAFARRRVRLAEFSRVSAGGVPRRFFGISALLSRRPLRPGEATHDVRLELLDRRARSRARLPVRPRPRLEALAQTVGIIITPLARHRPQVVVLGRERVKLTQALIFVHIPARVF